MRTVLFACLLAGCRTSSAPPDAQATPSPLATSTTASVGSDAGPPGAPELSPKAAAAIAQQWNVAHIKHDVPALQGLYAAHVQFYGQRFTNAECALAKKAAFEKSPDYTQSVRDMDVKPDGTVTFTKTSTAKGKSSDYPAILVVKDGLIVAETDKITDANLAAKAVIDVTWCTEGGVANDRVRAPFKIDARTAVERGHKTKHFAAVTAANGGAFLDFGQIACPATCGDRTKRQCGFDMRLENHDPSHHATSNLVEWIYVDAIDGALWWEETSGWKSEPLPR